ncbi:MAG: prephenate dehydrogenase/arogenate dehydrogenase family protein [Syntrophaceae bacterium]|nr:prephenate dehydrogenase/arogenate dehydrogenase family protein [Syntrophaceae bacterium]
MKEAVIGIIGGTGGMGQWFAELLRCEGYTVHCAGRKDGLRPEEMARTCNAVVISVPIGVTREVIEKIGPLLPPENLLMDLTSLKEEPVKAMLDASRCEVIGCHPLFGPAIKSLAGHNVVLCPGRGTVWFSWLQTILEKNQAVVTVTTPENHDRMMSVVQVLNHLHTIHLGLVLGGEQLTVEELKPWSTPVFDQKVEMIRKVFQDQPGMYAEILVNNPHLDKICEHYRQSLDLLETAVRKKNPDQIIDLMKQNREILWSRK